MVARIPLAVSGGGYGTAAFPVAIVRPPRDVNGAIAFLCWFLLGGLGLHRFYLGQTTHGVVMAVTNLTLIVLTAGVWAVVTFFWWLVELFLLPGAIRKVREGVA